MSTPYPTAPVPGHGPADPDRTTEPEPLATSGSEAGGATAGSVDPAATAPEPAGYSHHPDDDGSSSADNYGVPEPPDRGAQHAFDAPPAAPPESETYPWPGGPVGAEGSSDRELSLPPPPPSGWQPRAQAWPYVGGQPSPTPYESPTPYPYPAAVSGGPAPRPGALPPPRAGAYGPPSGGYSTPTGAYPPYGYIAVDPYSRSRTVAGILGILVGGLGVHRFYLGYIGIGVLQIAVTLVTFGAGALWGFVEGILYLTQRTGQFTVDATGRPLRE